MNVAILCSGLDSVQRGYETHQRLLFDHLRRESGLAAQFTLFKRDGARLPDEVPLGSPSRASRVVRALDGWRGDELYWESAFFAAAFIAHCRARGRRFDRILTIEPYLAAALRKLRPLLPGRPRLVFTQGLASEPRYYMHLADEVHEVNVENHARSTRENPQSIPVRLIPHFLPHAPGPPSPGQKTEARATLGIATPLALLSVGVVQRAQKRMDYVIREAARLPPEWSLVLCGAPAEPELVALGRELMGSRFVQVFLPRERVGLAYRAADAFVLGSLHEGFGISIIEAMSHGLPVVVHDRPLFAWITGDPRACIDLGSPGTLSRHLAGTVADEGWRRETGRANYRTACQRFTWERVREAYLELACGSPAQAHAPPLVPDARRSPPSTRSA